MNIPSQNIYAIPDKDSWDKKDEYLHKLLSHKDLVIEKIISAGHITKPGFWYEQEMDELVFLLTGNAVIQYFDLSEIELKPGDFLMIPRYVKHRVIKTSENQECIWLAIHGKLL